MKMFNILLFAIICTASSIIIFLAGNGISSLVAEIILLILVDISAAKFYKERKKCIK